MARGGEIFSGISAKFARVGSLYWDDAACLRPRTRRPEETSVHLTSPRLAAAPERLRVLLIADGTADAGRLAVALTAGGAAVTLAATLAAADAEVRSGAHEVITLALAGWELEALELLI